MDLPVKLRFNLWFKLLLIFLAYYLTGRLGIHIIAVSGFASLVWAPSGIALASILLFGYQVALSIFAAAFLVNLPTGVVVAIGIATGNTLAAVLGAWYLKRITRISPRLERLKDVLALIFFGGVVSTLISSTSGTTWAWLIGFISHSDYLNTWFAWWLGDMTGILIFTPLMLVLSNKPDRRYSFFKLFELLVAFGLFVFISLVVLSEIFYINAARWPIMYLIFPPLIWIVLGFSQKEIVIALFYLFLVGIWGTLNGYGIFARSDLSESLFFLQGFLGITSITFLIFGSIIAERKNLEQRKDDFISMASHELKTPLTTIKAYTELIDRAAGRNSRIKQFTLRMNEQVDRLVKLVNDLLDASRAGIGKINFKFEKMYINGLIKEVLEDTRFLNHHKIIFKASRDAIVYADRFRISQVLINLINNAIKFSPGSKKVILETNVDRWSITVSIKDFGVGIPEEYSESIFGRFFQINNFRNSSNGLGLGLYICSQIIKRHGGRIWVDSKVGKGSVFSFQLPLFKEKLKRV